LRGVEVLGPLLGHWIGSSAYVVRGQVSVIFHEPLAAWLKLALTATGFGDGLLITYRRRRTWPPKKAVAAGLNRVV
jgi:hypothetical protein